MRKILTAPLLLLIQAYRYLVSPLFGSHCRYIPSCSEYALQAITTHGPVKGVWLALKRLGSCHPWHEGGHDPVPGSCRDHKHG